MAGGFADLGVWLWRDLAAGPILPLILLVEVIRGARLSRSLSPNTGRFSVELVRAGSGNLEEDATGM